MWPQAISSIGTLNTAAIFWRSAGLGVQRPSAIAVMRPSSRPLRCESSAHVEFVFAAEIGDSLDHGECRVCDGFVAQTAVCKSLIRQLAQWLAIDPDADEYCWQPLVELYRILAVSIIPIDGI